MKCPNCNAEIQERICPFCGSEMPVRKKSGSTTINITNNYYTDDENPRR